MGRSWEPGLARTRDSRPVCPRSRVAVRGIFILECNMFILIMFGDFIEMRDRCNLSPERLCVATDIIRNTINSKMKRIDARGPSINIFGRRHNGKRRKKGHG